MLPNASAAVSGHLTDSRAPGRSARTAATAVAVTLAVTLAALTAVLGYLDGTGLFAPENWVDAGAVPTGGTSPAWATVVFLPALIVGSAAAAYGVIRAAGPGVRTRWVVGAVWSGLVLTAFVAKFVFSLVLLSVAGPHGLHLAPTVGAILAECGLTGAKYAVFGLPAAAPAAFAHRLCARASRAVASEPADATVPGCSARRAWSPLWLIPGALIATAAAETSCPWFEGRGHAVILPFAGSIGSWLALRALWPRIRAGLPSRPSAQHTVVTWWAYCAATTAATSLGFLLPFLVDGILNGFGGALYPIVGAVMHVAAGVTAGATTCALGTLWAALCARTRSLALPHFGSSRLGSFTASIRRPPVGRYALPALAVAVVLGADLLPSALASVPAAYQVPSAASADGRGLLPLTVLRENGQAPTIADSAGRQVLLRGVNVNQLIDYGQQDKSQPTVRPLTDADYALMASRYGFDVQRLDLSWSLLEPARGQFDQAYISRIRTAVDQAAAHGVYTVLDMHQDTYSKYVTAAPGTTCRPGSTPEFGNDGAPAWATLTDGAKGCGFLGRDLSPNVEQSFTNLYDDTDGIADQLAATWGELAQSFAGDSAVAGYDLLNEPGPGDSPGVTSSLLLGRLYQQIITAIRTGESRAQAPGAYHHLVFFEPSILWSGLGFDVTPPVGFSSDPDLVFSPHLYSQSITMDQGLGITLVSIEHGFTTAQRAAAAYGVPLWSGEWGWFGDQASSAAPFDRFLTQQNADLLGSAVWVWKKACGDPQSTPGDPTDGGINIYSCTTGKDLPTPAFETAALSQAYPRSAPGRLTSLASSPVTLDMSLAGTGTGLLDVWVPGTAQPTIAPSGLADLTVTPQPGGGFRITAHATGNYSLTVTSP